MKKNLLFISANMCFLLLLTVIASGQGLVNLSFEDAQSLGKGGFDVKPIYTHQTAVFNGRSESIGNHYGGIIGYGFTNKFDLKARYEKQVPPSDWATGNTDYFSLIPKYSPSTNVSFMLPLSWYTGSSVSETFNMYSIAPNVLITIPVMKNEADVSISAKGDILFNKGEKAQGLIGFSVGAGISNDLAVWAFRPEAGYIFQPGDQGGQWTWGLGLQLLFGKKGTK